MSAILEVDERGNLQLPPDILPISKPHTRYVASTTGHQVVLAPTENEKPFWMTATPAERAEDILRWAANHIDGPGLPDKATHRDGIYD
jgi:hypothetical protein